MLFAPMGSMWLRWVCSDVGVVCSDRCIMGQVVDWHGGPWVMRFGFGLIWVDRCIVGQTPIDVASTFFWVDHRRFSGYFRRPGFQICGVHF